MIRVKVPATSANIGPGFDTMGIALNLYNYFYVEETDGGLNITGCEERLCNENNLVYQSMVRLFDKVGYKAKGINIRVGGDIPLSRGFGSSASCILGGVLAANEIAGKPLNKEELLNLAIDIEGHPDNVAPALLGQLVLSIMEDGRIIYNRVKVEEGLKFCALVPEFSLSTKKSREVLPSIVPYKDAVFNLSRSSLLVSALMNGNFDLIRYACQDKLHQPYRGKLIANFDDIIHKSNELNSLASYLSGAGPTIMVIIRKDDQTYVPSIKNFLKTLAYRWDVIELEPDLDGSKVEVS